MPAKNAATYLVDCIDSVLNQSFTNWELIIIDDFSADNTVEIIQNYIKSDARIKYLPNRVSGIIPALQLAFNNSSGLFITRMDADDLMPPDKLQVLINKLSKYNRSVVTGKVCYFSDQKLSEGYLRYETWLNSLIDKKEFFAAVYRECIIASPNWLVSRSCFEKDFQFSDLSYPEDYDMVFQWYKSGYKIISVDAVTHLWREHTARTSRHHEAYQQQAFFELKTNYFIDLEIENNEKIQLFGAGLKGKLVAKTLIEKKVNFDWFDFNISENSKNIFDKKVSSVFDSISGMKSIITVWPIDPNIQNEIQIFFNDREFIFGKNCWLF